MDFLKLKASLAFLKLENKKIRASMGLFFESGAQMVIFYNDFINEREF